MPEEIIPSFWTAAAASGTDRQRARVLDWSVPPFWAAGLGCPAADRATEEPRPPA